MKYCKNCHVLYSGYAAACPKCGALTKAPANKGEPAKPGEPGADARRVRRDWLWIAVGVPALIAVTYLIVYLVKRFS